MCQFINVYCRWPAIFWNITRRRFSFVLAGPATEIAPIGTIKKHTGLNNAIGYLSGVITRAIVCGYMRFSLDARYRLEITDSRTAVYRTARTHWVIASSKTLNI
ncbi:MAG: hypothetical protein ACI93R_002245 [Flavobacteriales bacterium]|jgi:hypothetical protein